jgi:hypothetical protein
MSHERPNLDCKAGLRHRLRGDPSPLSRSPPPAGAYSHPGPTSCPPPPGSFRAPPESAQHCLRPVPVEAPQAWAAVGVQRNWGPPRGDRMASCQGAAGSPSRCWGGRWFCPPGRAPGDPGALATHCKQNISVEGKSIGFYRGLKECALGGPEFEVVTKARRQ